MNKKENNRCPCCNYQTITEEWEICEVCFWEKNFYQEENIDDDAGPNHVSLRQAIDNFKRIGASEENVLKFVRSPREDEM